LTLLLFRFKLDTPKQKGREKEKPKLPVATSRPNTVMMKEEGEGEEAGVVRATLKGRAGDEAALERFKEATAQKKKK
jgi:hypothetical protein